MSVKKKTKVGLDEKLGKGKLKIIVSSMTADWWVEEGYQSFRKWARKNIQKYVEVE